MDSSSSVKQPCLYERVRFEKAVLTFGRRTEYTRKLRRAFALEGTPLDHFYPLCALLVRIRNMIWGPFKCVLKGASDCVAMIVVKELARPPRIWRQLEAACVTFNNFHWQFATCPVSDLHLLGRLPFASDRCHTRVIIKLVIAARLCGFAEREIAAFGHLLSFSGKLARP